MTEDNQTFYDPANGHTAHAETFDTTFNILDPIIAPNLSTSCMSSTDPTCHGIIHSEIDHDWKAGGYCGTGTVCDNATLASQTSYNSTLIDVQGFISWDPDNLNAPWHQFNGWEIHPLTAWRRSSTVNFSASPPVPQVGQPVTLTATSNGTTPSSFAWNFGDGATASGKTVSHIYVTPQAFNVRVSMTDTQGITVSTTKILNVGGSWNQAVSCEPAQTTLEHVIGSVSIQRIPTDPNSIGADYSGGGYKLDGNLTYGSNPTTWPFNRRDLHPPCVVIGTSAYLEFHNVTFTDINVANCGTHYANGTSYPHGWQSCDTTFNLITPGYGDPATCPTCYMHKIYGGIDRDWNASGIAPLPRPTDGQRIDVQGFIFWNHDAVNATWHSYSGWEIHPLTAWRPMRPRITASATFTPSNPIAGQTVNFTGTGTGGTGPYTFNWDFGDGSNVTKGNPVSHVFGSGTYAIHMSANDSTGNFGVASQTVMVAPPPDFSITVNPSSLSLPAKSSRTAGVNLTSTFGFAGNVSLAYVAPSGVGVSLTPKSMILSQGGSASSSLTLTPSTAGNYSVRITATSGPLSHSANVTLRVTDAPPTVSFTASATTAFRNQPITLTITASDPDGTVTSLRVSWGDGFVHTLPGSSTSDTHAYVKAGSFTVNVTATDNAGLSASATAVEMITDAPPVARFTESLTTAPTGTVFNFNASTSFDPDGSVTSFAWRFGDGSTATGVTASHSYVTAGSYTVTLIVTDNATLTGNATSTKTVTDRPPAVSFTESATTAPTGTSISLTITATDPDGTISLLKVSWGDGRVDNLPGNATSDSHVYTSTGSSKSAIFTVYANATDNSGSTTKSATATKTITDRAPTASFTESATSALTGVSISFNATASSDPDGTISAYNWMFGDGGTGTGVIVSHSYANTGNSKTKTYTVTLTVTDNSGNTGNSTSTKMIADRNPIASFTESATSALTGVSISFNATFSSDPDGAIASYVWTFGDGGTGTGPVVTHSYVSTGNARNATFTVILTVTDNSGNTGTATSTKTIIDRNPTASFTESTTSALTGVSISFNATTSSDPDGTISSYSWIFGDGGTGTGRTVSHTYANTGNLKVATFTVTLTVTDNGGSTGTATSTKTITDRNPTASFTESATSALTGASISFNATSSSDPDGTIASYSWNFGDGGMANGAVVSHSYANTGNAKTATFTVTLTVTDNSGNTGLASSTKTITDRSPIASFTESTTSAFTGVSITFNATSSSDPDGTLASYSWTFGDGGTGSGAIVSHIYSNTGNAKTATPAVTLLVADNSGNTGTATSTKTITDRNPTAIFTESTTSALTGVSISFNATTSSDPDGTISSYSWIFGDGGTGTGRTITHSYANTGTAKNATFTVTLTVTDNSGNTGTATSAKTITDRNPTASFTESATSALTGASISFNATSSSDPDGTIASYSWNFGDGGSGTGAIVSHSYANTGNAKTATFTVTLTVTDNSGNIGTAISTKTITDRNPVARFTESATSALTGTSITFNATASSDPDGTISGYNWSFGDGGAARGPIVSHSYANTGNAKNTTFTVTLTVTDNSGNIGNATSAKTITDRNPIARFSESTTSALTGVSISFNATTSTDPDGTISSYRWMFGDGGTGTGTIVTHAYASTGSAKNTTFTVTLTVTDNNGNTATTASSKTIIDRNPVASFTESTTSGGIGVPITFDARASTDPDGTISSYNWAFGDGTTSTGPTASHAYASIGTFTVTLTVTDNSGNSGTATATKTITPDEPPIASFTESTTSALTGVSISFNASASVDPDGFIISYAWNFGDGSTGTGITTTHSYANTGSAKTMTYTVTLTVTDNSTLTRSASSTKTITDHNPIASFTESTTSALTGVSISFNATASSDPDGTITTYTWNFGDGGTGTGAIVSHSYASTGNAKIATFIVTLTVTDNSGNNGNATSTKTITDRNPTASFTESTTSALTGVNISFNATSSSDPDGTITNYAWSFGDGGSATGPIVSHSYANTGNTKSAAFIVMLTVTDNSGNTATTTSTKTVTDRKPTASFTESATSVLTGVNITFNGTGSVDLDGTITAYAWSFGDGGFATGQVASHSYANTGSAKMATFTVTLTVTDNSGNTGNATATKTITDRNPIVSFTESTTFTLTGVGISFNATASSDLDGNISSYSWTFGDGGTAIGAVVSHAYASTGNTKFATFNVTLTVSDNSGNTGTAQSTKTITDRNPIASFTESATSGLTGVNISFNATASNDPDGTITTYSWNFGDGGTGTGKTVSHIYASTGSLKAATYTVTLTITDNSGNTATAQSTKTITDRNPTASFTESATSTLTGVSISFNATASADSDGTISLYSWTFGDGGTGTGAIVTHSYANIGNAKTATFTVTLNVTDNSGSTTKTTSTKTVTDRKPTASFTESATSVLTGVSINFNATASSDPDGFITVYSWAFGDGGTASGAIVSHNYASTGNPKTATFTVILTVTDNSGNMGNATSTKAIADRSPSASFTESTTSGLTGVNISFNATASNDPDGTITTYSWNFGDGGTGTGKTVSHIYASTGSLKVAIYTVTLNVTDNSGNTGTATSTKTVTDRNPTATFTESATIVLTGGSINFNATGSNDPDGTIATYSWNFGDGTTGVGKTVSHAYANTGNAKTVTFPVTLTVADNSGNTGNASSTKTVTDRSPNAIFTESVTSALTGVNITFNATASADPDGTITTYAWTFGDGGTGAGKTVSHAYANTGNAKTASFIVTLNVTDNAGNTGTAQSTKTITDRNPTASFTESTTSALTGTSISFNATASSDPDGTITGYVWAFGDGGMATGPTVSHTYANIGILKVAAFTVRLTVTDNSGNSATTQSTKTITDRNPTASFTESTTSPVIGAPVSFNATTSTDPDGSIASYAWNFGDGSTGTGVTITHTYTSAATRTVTLNVTDNSGNSAKTTSIKTVVDENPTASFTESATSALTSVSISFNATASSDPDGRIVSYAWNFGDGSPAVTLTTPLTTHTYAGTGSIKVATFTVTLTVTDNATLTGTSQATKTITDRPPTASFIESVTSTLTGISISFNATASSDSDGNVASYAWNFGDGGTGTGPVVAHVYATTGNLKVATLTVNLTVTDNSGSTGTAQSTKTITDRGPTASLSLSATSALTGVSINFNATASRDPDGTISNYNWNFGDGNTGTGVLVTHSYANAGNAKAQNFTVTLTVTDNSGNIATAVSLVTITDRPPLASFTESAATVYTGTNVSFNATASSDPDGRIAIYSWSFGDGSTGTGATVSHSYSLAGNYTVTLTVTDNSSNQASSTFKETVLDRPPVVVLSSSSTSILTLTSITFNGTGSYDPDGTVVGYAWNFGDSSTGSGIVVSHSYAKTGNYTVVLAVTDNSGIVSSKSIVENILDRPPTASFVYSPTNPLTGQTVNYNAGASNDPDGTVVGYAWSFGDGLTGTGPTVSHAYATNGTFTVLLTVTDNSGSKGTASTTLRVGNDPAPVFPLGSVLTASNIDAHSLTLTWTPANDSVQVTSYKIYANGTLLVTLPGSVTSYNVNGLIPLAHFLFLVQAGNPSGNYSTNGPSTRAFTRLRGDVNLDCRVDISDLSLVGAAFGSKLGDPRYNPNADLNGDGVIDITDLSIVGANFGRTC